MRTRKRHQFPMTKRRPGCELLEPRLMLSTTEAPVGDASFVLYDNSVAATVATDFSRDVETLDGLGNLVTIDERRFGEELTYTPSVQWSISQKWEELKAERYGGSLSISFRVLGSGWDHDGQSPLLVLSVSGNFDELLFLGGEDMEVVGAIQLTTDYFLPGLVNGKRHRPESLIVHHGLVVIAAERYENVTTSVGVDFFTTQNYGQTLEQVPFVGGGFEVPAIEGGVSQGIKRLQTWAFLNAFPVDSIEDTESVWFPWADYLGKDGAVRPKGGQVGLFRADRSLETGEWILSPNRLVHSEWNPEDTGGFHAHAAAVTTGGVISHWGDVGYRNVTKFHQFDLNDYQNATITTTDVFGGSDFTAQEYQISPQPVATAPSPVAGEHFASGDNTPDHVLSFGALANTGDQLEIEAKIYQDSRSASGKVHDGPVLLHMHWVQGLGYVTGGRVDSYFYYSPDGLQWTEFNSPEDIAGRMSFYGDRLIAVRSNSIYLTDGLPSIESVRPLQISPGGENSVAANLESYRDPGAGNTRRQVLYQDAAWRYADTLVPLDVQAVPPQFSTSAAVYEFTVGNQSTNLGGWWLDPAGTTHNASDPYLAETWVFNLADQGIWLGMGNHVIGDGQSSPAPLRFHKVVDTTQWLSLGASIAVDNPFDGEGRYATTLDSYFKSPGSRFLVALPYAGQSLAPTYPQAPQASGSDELESVSGLGFADNWSMGLVARWPDNSQQRNATRMPVASLTGTSGDAIEISFTYSSTHMKETRLQVDFYKAGNLAHSESQIEDLLRGDWIELVVSSGSTGTNVTFLIAGQLPVTFTNSMSLDLALESFQWASLSGDTITGIDPVLAVFDNDLAWNEQQQQEWIYSSFADKVVYQAKPAVGDYNSDGEVDAADYTIWRDTNGTPITPGTGGDGDHSGFVDLADLVIWQQNYGTHVPTLSELRAAAAINSSSESAAQTASQPEPTLLSAVETTEKTDTTAAAFLRSQNRSSAASPRFLFSRNTSDSRTIDRSWELLAAEDAYRVNANEETTLLSSDLSVNQREQEEELPAMDQNISQSDLREKLVDEALITIVL